MQGIYNEGGVIEVEVLVTTHHKGHFEFAACAIGNASPMPIPSEECFASGTGVVQRSYRLAARGWCAVHDEVSAARGIGGGRGPSSAVLTAGQFAHEGYAEYPFSEEWGKDVLLYLGLPDCGEVPPDGNGVLEQVRARPG